MDRPYFPFILCQLSNLACWRVVIGPAFYELTGLRWVPVMVSYNMLYVVLGWKEMLGDGYGVVCLCCNMLSGKAWCAYNCVLFPIWKATGQWVASRWSLLAQCWFRCNTAIVFIYSIVLQLHTLVCIVELGKATDWQWKSMSWMGRCGNLWNDIEGTGCGMIRYDI